MSYVVSNAKVDVGPALAFAAAYGVMNGRLAVAGEDSTIRIFHPDDAYRRGGLAITAAMTEKQELKMPVTALRFRPNDASNVLLAAACDGSLSFWHIGAMKMVQSLREEGSGTYAADYSPSGALLATGGTDGALRLYDAAHSHALLARFSDGPTAAEPKAHPTRIQSVRFADENTALTGGWDRVVHVWDVRQRGSSSGRPVASVRGPYLGGDGMDVSGGTMLVCASSERHAGEAQVELFDLRRPDAAVCGVALPPAIEGAAPPSLYAARFSPQRPNIVAIGGTDYYGLFDVVAGKALESVPIAPSAAERGGVGPGSVFCAAWSTDGRRCFFGGRGAVVVEAQ